MKRVLYLFINNKLYSGDLHISDAWWFLIIRSEPFSSKGSAPCKKMGIQLSRDKGIDQEILCLGSSHFRYSCDGSERYALCEYDQGKRERTQVFAVTWTWPSSKSRTLWRSELYFRYTSGYVLGFFFCILTCLYSGVLEIGLSIKYKQIFQSVSSYGTDIRLWNNCDRLHKISQMTCRQVGHIMTN